MLPTHFFPDPMLKPIPLISSSYFQNPMSPCSLCVVTPIIHVTRLTPTHPSIPPHVYTTYINTHPLLLCQKTPLLLFPFLLPNTDPIVRIDNLKRFPSERRPTNLNEYTWLYKRPYITQSVTHCRERRRVKKQSFPKSLFNYRGLTHSDLYFSLSHTQWQQHSSLPLECYYLLYRSLYHRAGVGRHFSNLFSH